MTQETHPLVRKAEELLREVRERGKRGAVTVDFSKGEVKTDRRHGRDGKKAKPKE